MHSTQPGKGVPYALMPNTYQITICGFSIFKKNQKLVDKYTMRNENGRELTDAITCVFVDLTFMGKLADKEVSKMSPIEMWSLFLGGADKIKYRDKINEIMKVKKEISMADALLRKLSMDENEWYHYRMRQKWKQDHENDIIVATAEGRAEGRAEGIAIGEERGIAIGEERGIAVGTALTSIEVAVNAIKEWKFSVENAIALVKLAPEHRNQIISELQKQGIAYTEEEPQP